MYVRALFLYTLAAHYFACFSCTHRCRVTSVKRMATEDARLWLSTMPCIGIKTWWSQISCPRGDKPSNSFPNHNATPGGRNTLFFSYENVYACGFIYLQNSKATQDGSGRTGHYEWQRPTEQLQIPGKMGTQNILNYIFVYMLEAAIKRQTVGPSTAPRLWVG